MKAPAKMVALARTELKEAYIVIPLDLFRWTDDRATPQSMHGACQIEKVLIFQYRYRQSWLNSPAKNAVS